MFSKTLTLDSSTLFLASHHSLSPQPPLPLSFSLLSSGSTLPPIPPDFPQSKLIPKTRFVVDGFRHAGDYSVSYFLSHFHSDHYTGLAPNWCKGIVFCSPTTARLLIKVLKIPASFVVPLPLSERVSIDGCEISLVDANHCPGAVQFVFKIPGNDGKIERYVHTGDFRYCDSMKSDPILCEYNGADAVFLDTTYCNPKYVFPSQEESIDYIANVIEKIGVQNEGSKKSVLFLVATYVIGKEKILLEVSRRCNRKIHVDSRKMAILGVLGFGQGVFTEVESETDVHVVGWSVLGETWPYFRPNFAKIEEIMIERGYSKVVGFVPTGWTYEVKRNKFAVRTKESMEIHLVPYSEHSNYDELRRYVKFLKPKHVVPTVGTDANEIHKHFVGLVDEMAVKKEFLLGYLREGSKENDVDLGNVEHSTSSKQQPCTRDLVSENDDEVEELVRELRDCLPTWVTRDQMLDLLSGSSKNVVEAVSNFYENETEFREQVTASSSPACTSQEIPFIKPCSVKSSPETKEVFLSQSYKTPLVAKLSKSSASSKKRRKNMENKSTKKARVKPSVESSGPKQCTITRFFGKLGQNVSQGGGVETSLNQCRDDKKLSELDDVQPYKEEVNRFIQIIHGNESLRSYASTILEEAKGDINMALDIYYSNPMGSSIEKNDQCSTIISIDQEKELSEKSGLLSDNVESTSVSLPPEKYSPVEDGW